MSVELSNAVLNGLDLNALRTFAGNIAADPRNAMTSWAVSTQWLSGARTDTKVSRCEIAGQVIDRDYTISIDEPTELCGSNKFANPQEYLIAAFNACIAVGYVALCALEGIEIKSLRIETSGSIDLRGFFGDPQVKAGLDSIHYDVYIQADAEPGKLREIHDMVTATSPNRFNLATAIPTSSQLHL